MKEDGCCPQFWLTVNEKEKVSSGCKLNSNFSFFFFFLFFPLGNIACEEKDANVV